VFILVHIFCRFFLFQSTVEKQQQQEATAPPQNTDVSAMHRKTVTGDEMIYFGK